MKLSLPPLKIMVNKLEDGIITLSGPALAISGIIAGVDLVTGGNMLKSVGGLSMTWAICLLLTLDFQVLALGARAHRVYLSTKDNKRKVFEIVLAVIVACAISYVSIQMQSIIARVNSEVALSIDQATTQLGINPIALIWERSSLVLVLIFLSGWFREDDHEQVAVDSTIVPSIQVQQPDIEQVLAPIIERLDEMYNKRMDIMIERVTEQVTVSIEQNTQPRLPAIAESTITSIEQVQKPSRRVQNVVQSVPSKVTKSEQVKAYLEQEKVSGRKPTLQQIMDSQQCSKGTAIDCRKKVYGQEP